jgi:hypothetical protein
MEFPTVIMLLPYNYRTSGNVSCCIGVIFVVVSKHVRVATFLSTHLTICNHFSLVFPIPLTSFLIYLVVSVTETTANVNLRRFCY